MTTDPVNPDFYIGSDGLQAIEVVESWGLGAHLAAAFQYVVRAGRKGDRDTDLDKAAWYLERAKHLPALDGGPAALVSVRIGPFVSPARVVRSFDLDCFMGGVVFAIHRVAFGEVLAIDAALEVLTSPDMARRPVEGAAE